MRSGIGFKWLILCQSGGSMSYLIDALEIGGNKLYGALLIFSSNSEVPFAHLQFDLR